MTATSTTLVSVKKILDVTIPTTTINNPERIVCVSNGTFAVGGSTTNKTIVVYDINGPSGTWLPRPKLPGTLVALGGTSEFGYSFTFVGQDSNLLVVGDPGENKVYVFQYTSTSATWAIVASPLTLTVPRFGEHVAAPSRNMVMVGCGYARGEVFHTTLNHPSAQTSFFKFFTVDEDVLPLSLNSPTAAMYGAAFDTTQDGIIIVGHAGSKGSAPSNYNNTLSVYGLSRDKWSTVVSLIVSAGSRISSSANGETIAALTGVAGVGPHNLALATVNLSPVVALTAKPTTSVIPVAEEIRGFVVLPAGNAVAVATSTAFKIYEYHDLSQTWVLSLSVVGSNYRGVTANRVGSGMMILVISASGNGNDANVEIYSRRETQGLDAISGTQGGGAIGLTLDAVPVYLRTDEYILNRGPQPLGVGYRPSRVDGQILNSVRDLQIDNSLFSSSVSSSSNRLGALTDVNISRSKNMKDGRSLTFSSMDNQWSDSYVWWEDLRFPLTTTPKKTFIVHDICNSGVVFESSAILSSSDTYKNGKAISMLAQMPHSWAEGTEVRPHIHWRQTTSHNLNWMLLVRIIKNNATDSAQPLETDQPLSFGNNGTANFASGASDIIAYVGRPTFTYPGYGAITQITSFCRKLVDPANQNNNRYTSTGIDMTGCIGSTMVGMTLIRDAQNRSGLFDPSEAGSDWEASHSVNPVLVYELDVHYLHGSFGSTQELPEQRNSIVSRYI